MNRIVSGALLGLVGVLLTATPASTQGVDVVTAAYYRAAAQAYRVAESEVLILAEWGLPSDEMPVILYLARMTRVSPDAVVSMRRGGQSWGAILKSNGIDAGRLHVELGGAPPLVLADAYRGFQTLPRERWAEVELSDDAVVHLVNIRFLADHTGNSPGRVVEVRGGMANFAATYRALIGGPRPRVLR